MQQSFTKNKQWLICKIFTALYEGRSFSYFRVYNNSPLIPILNQLNPIDIATTWFVKPISESSSTYIHAVIRAILYPSFCRHVRVYKDTYINTRIYWDVAPRDCLYHRRQCSDNSNVSSHIGLSLCLASATFILTKLGSLQMLSVWQWDAELASPSLAPA